MPILMMMLMTGTKNGGRVPGIITRQRETRTSVLYEVVWLGRPFVESTWESAETLPKDLVSSFEKGIKMEVQRLSINCAGQTIHTPTAVKDSTGQSSKHRKLDVTEAESDSTGSFVLPEDCALKLTCRTEKDSHGRLNHRTAGILAGIHPCGFITIVSELFGAESNSQVYGLLHAYFSKNQSATASIDTICYDDACHLMKYTKNTSRSALTPTTKRLAGMSYAVDRMHFRGHVDPWCRENCNPDKMAAMKGVNSEICEQTFSWFSRYARITRHMNRERFLFFILYICELRNRNL